MIRKPLFMQPFGETFCKHGLFPRVPSRTVCRRTRRDVVDTAESAQRIRSDAGNDMVYTRKGGRKDGGRAKTDKKLRR